MTIDWERVILHIYISNNTTISKAFFPSKAIETEESPPKQI